MKKAIITGITGQDGSYLAELLVQKGYEVHGTIRRTSDSNHKNLTKIKNQIIFHQTDLTDYNSISRCIENTEPDEIYNLAAQSHVKISFDLPLNTADVNALGPLRVLEAIRNLKANIRFYQASTSELYGATDHVPQNENTTFKPASPYGVAKLFAHWTIINYRSAYNIFACNGILFNHESPRRGEIFVTKKITKKFAEIFLDISAGRIHSPLELGNLNSMRDWGHAIDYVEAMWLMLQQDHPDDYVICTQIQYSIRDFCNMSGKYFNMDLEWEGQGQQEYAVDRKTGKVIVTVNPEFYRPVDVTNLLGDSSKARNILNWIPKYDLNKIVEEMCEYEIGENK